VVTPMPGTTLTTPTPIFGWGGPAQAGPGNIQRHSVVHGQWGDAIHPSEFEGDQRSLLGGQRDVAMVCVPDRPAGSRAQTIRLTSSKGRR